MLNFLIVLWWKGQNQPEATSVLAEQAMERGDFQAAYEMAERLLKQNPDALSMRMLAAEAASRIGMFSQAIEHYARIPDAAPMAATARWAAAEVEYEQGHTDSALKLLDRAIDLKDLLPAHDRAAAILTTLGRRRESLPHLLRLIQSDEVTIEHLLTIGNLAKEITSQAELERLGKLDPANRHIDLPWAIHAREQGNFDESRHLLEALLKQQPDLLEAHVQLGWTLLKSDPSLLDAWLSALPTTAQQHPDVLAVEAQMLQSRGHLKEAIGMNLGAIALDSEHLPALTAVAQLLQRDGQAERATAFAERARKIQKLNLALEQIYVSRRYLPPVQEAADLTNELGRPWECVGWCAYALSIAPQADWPKQMISRVRSQVRPGAPRTSSGHNPALTATWRSEYPLLDQKQLVGRLSLATKSAESNPDAKQIPAEVPAIRFVDVAKQAGIEFQLLQPPRKAADGRRMFEITGAGSAAIDFDNDGWCDLYVVQASTSIPALDTSSPRGNETDTRLGDQLFRSAGKAQANQVHFTAVSAPARIVERAYGQGATVGDVNSDGYDDVYVGNFGANQLWLNQGDGTFVSGEHLFSGKLPDQWTVSTAIADVNFDGWADIYDVNYVTGPEVTTKLCAVAGLMRACTPLVFTAAPHVLWLGSSEGQLTPFHGAGSQVLQGYGLGIVVAKLAGGTTPHMFVAIDQQANLLLNLKAENGEHATQPWSLIDEAVVRGVALDQQGRSQACMGIAADDLNGDGQIDFYVTNFFDESNTLYVQNDGYFQDETTLWGLTAPSMPMLGFGTQALDVQGDGRKDLVVLNGHIDDHSHTSTPYHMRPQIYQQTVASQRSNSASRPGKFVDAVEQLKNDAFFSSLRLGRSLTKLDFDRDGREDLVATDLEQPLALLHNQSPSSGSTLTIHLVGTQSDRNAFCTIGTLTSDDGWQRTEQLVAGSGYMSSNQRCLRFVLPERATDKSFTLELQWPSGIKQRALALTAGDEYVIVEKAN